MCNPVQPDPDEAPTGLRLQALPVSITEDGTLATPEPTYTYPLAQAGQRDTKVTLDVQVDDGTHITRDRVESSNRSCMPVSWRTTVTNTAGGATVTDMSWLQVGGESGSGAAMQLHERMFENYGEDNELHHNPQMGGAGNTGHEADPGVEVKLYGGRVIEYSASGSTHVGCVHPMDFGGDPDNNADSNHDGDGENNPLLWWQNRLYQKVDLHYQGDANISRVTNWWYAPSEWNDDGVSSSSLTYLVSNNAVRPLTFDQAFIVNMVTGTYTEVADFAAPDPILDPILDRWDVSKVNYVKNGVQISAPGPVPEGKVAIFLRHAATEFSVAFVAKLTDTDDDAGLFTATQNRSPNYVNLQHFLVPGITSDLDENAGPSIQWISKTTGIRPAGWIGFQYFVVTGTTTDVQVALSRLANSGWLDEDPDDPSTTAKAGTAFPNADAAGVELPAPVEVPTLVGCGQSQMMAGYSQWWNLELDATLGKASAAGPISTGNPISTLDESLIAWNDTAKRFEALDVFRNAWGCFGDGAPNSFGPNVALAYAFKLRHQSCWQIWMGYNGAGMSNTNPLLPATWNAAGASPFIFSLAVTVTRIGDGTTATVESGIPGIFAAAVVGASVQIGGSALGYLDFAAGSSEHPLREVDADNLGGNNTHYGRGVRIAAIDGDASAVTLSGAGGSGVTYEFANETATLDFTYGPVELAGNNGIGTENIERAVAHALTKLNRTIAPELTLTFWGESEIGASQAQVSADLAAHIDWLRAELGISAVEPCPHGIIELTPFTPAGTDAEVLAVINGQRDVVDLRPRVFTVDTSPFRLRLESGPYPVTQRSENGTHYTAASLNRIGIVVDERYATFEDVPPTDPIDPFPGAGGDPQPPLDPYPGTGQGGGGGGSGGGNGGGEVDFIVEDGTGLEDADSYCEVDFATEYFTDYGLSTEWTAALTATRQQALRVASEYLDQTFQDRLIGYQLNPGVQALEIPRSMAWSKHGVLIEGVPIDVQKATCEVARRWLIDPNDLLPDEAAASNVQSKSLAVGPLRFDKSFSGSATTQKSFPIVEKLMRLSGLVQSSGWSVR